MPNRDLKESNRRSPSLQLLSDGAERLWYRIITGVDDYGRMEADPSVVFTTCFQRVPKGWTVQKVTSCLEELATKSIPGDQPLITLYQVGVRVFLEVVTAKQHIYQRAKTSKYPAPNDGERIQQLTQICAHTRTHAGVCTQIPSIPESRIPSPELRITNPESRLTGCDESAHGCAQTEAQATGGVESFSLTPELEAWSEKEGIRNPSQYLDEFLDYWRTSGGKRKNGQPIKDWTAAFRNRLRYLKDHNQLKSDVWT